MTGARRVPHLGQHCRSRQRWRRHEGLDAGLTWIVVSGFMGNRIFYRKAILVCGGRAWHYLEFEYPAAQKRAFDEFVAHSSAALGAYARSGCAGLWVGAVVPPLLRAPQRSRLNQ